MKTDTVKVTYVPQPTFNRESPEGKLKRQQSAKRAVTLKEGNRLSEQAAIRKPFLS